jgi:putative protease
MSELLKEPRPLFTLPVVTPDPPTRSATGWHGWNAVVPLDTPEPLEPQGAYRVGPETLTAISTPSEPVSGPVELLAPAGGPEAGIAAFHYGADAIYLGLKKFSARAEAENFTVDEVDEITAYAHSLTPRRRVFVTINTLIRQDELPELVDAVAHLAAIGVDALIIQDLGVYSLVRQHFPTLELHASTQLAVHNRAGAEALARLGFQRVVLARELTFEEVRDITAMSRIETEVFIHGALCYSYSGLCLFSSQTLGRSGNRGKCAYSCRDSYEVEGAPTTLRDGSSVKRDPHTGFPFSMKDLALPDHIPALRASGVSCFKIEGRKKSPLYVATTTDYYRRLIDGRMSDEERPDIEADLQTVFSRPWTHLFVQSHRDKEVADRDTVGHRGTPIGTVLAVVDAATREPRLRFRTDRPLEKHDGLQVDLPILGKPFGFAVERLWLAGKGKLQEVFEAPAGAVVEVSLPREHPDLPKGAPVYCSSSQVVKNRYRYDHPKPGAFHSRHEIDIEVRLSADGIKATGRVSPDVTATRTVSGNFTKARDLEAMALTARGAFEKLGQTRLTLGEFAFHNADGLFVPVSTLNQLRRDLTDAITVELDRFLQEKIAHITAEVVSPPMKARVSGAAFRWSIKVDRIGFLDALDDSDIRDIDEVIIDIARDHPTLLVEQLDAWVARIGRERIRLAIPPLTRAWEDRGIRHKIEHLRALGWMRWEAANLSAWSYLGLDPTTRCTDFDLSTDWSVYVINRLAARQLTDTMGVTRFALSPEDGLQNVRSLLGEFGARAVLIVYQDTPMFLAESCAYANLIGGCPGKANCKFESMEMVSSHGEKVTALDYHCRTIVLNQGPFCLSTRLPDLARAGAVSLRADFIYRPYRPDEVRDRWRQVRSGQAVPGGHAANFDRGVQ